MLAVNWLMFSLAVTLVIAQPLRADDKPDTSLVRARVASLGKKTDGGAVPATLEVLHVYSGLGELKGRTFKDYQREESSTGSEATSPFEVGEEAICVIRGADKVELVVARDDRFPFRYRSRKGDNTRHCEHLKLAEAVEKTENEKPDKRLTRLREFASDKTDEVAYWAMTAVGRLDTTDSRKHLDELAAKPDPNLSVAAQIALDEILCKQTEREWPDSKPRTAMIRGWVRSAQPEEVAGRVLSRIDMAHQRRELSDKLAVELLSTTVANAEWPKKTRRDALQQLWPTADRAASEEARTVAWECVFGRTKTNDDLALRRFAAEVVRLFPLYAARLKAVEEHLATEKDAKVAESLRAAVKKAKEADKK